ncbi:hypothetical protein E2320_008132, partial [Naja naja]
YFCSVFLNSQNLLCDVTIVAEDMEIAAHRVVLAACSPYFYAMFAGEMSESQAKSVQIKEVDGWTLKMLIEYIYTGEITVTEENVQVNEMIIYIDHKTRWDKPSCSGSGESNIYFLAYD